MNKLQTLLGASFFVSMGAVESESLLPAIVAISSGAGLLIIEKIKNSTKCLAAKNRAITKKSSNQKIA